VDSTVEVWVVALAAVPGVVAITVAIWLWVALRRVRAAQRVLLPDGMQGNVLDRQAALTRTIERIGDRVDALRGEVSRLAEHTDAGLRGALRFHGLVRYDAYADMGGEQSWSMAILNAERTGSIVTSLHARDHARVYLKEIVAGVPSQRLSPEEERAVAAALREPVQPFAPGSEDA
jgi:hypothetical protein